MLITIEVFKSSFYDQDIIAWIIITIVVSSSRKLLGCIMCIDQISSLDFFSQLYGFVLRIVLNILRSYAECRSPIC